MGTYVHIWRSAPLQNLKYQNWGPAHAAGKQILGGGAAITGGLGEVNLIGYRPVDSTLGSFIASATEDADGLKGTGP